MQAKHENQILSIINLLSGDSDNKKEEEEEDKKYVIHK